MIYDFKTFKEAKALLPQLNLVLYILKLTETSLKPFGYLTPVAKILIVIKEQKYILEMSRMHYNKIKELKALKK
jgi:hypothetical protein